MLAKPKHKPETIKRYRELDTKLLDSIVRDIRFLSENNLKCRVVIPDWDLFQSKVEKSEYSIVDSDGQRPFAIVVDGEEFGVQQSLINTYYSFGGPIYGYGFSHIQCGHCGNRDLFFDQKELVAYCPRCES